MKRSSHHSGFTLVELLVALVIGSIVVLAMHQVLQVQSASVRAQSAQVAVQQANRATVGVLSAELREVDAAAGDLLVAGTDSIKVRVMRKLGVVCRPDTLSQQLNVWELGDAFAATDSVVMFIDGDTTLSMDDTWRTGYVTATDTLLSSLNCPNTNMGGIAARRRLLTLGVAGSLSGIKRGGIIRAFDHVTYGLYQIDGQWMIARRDEAGVLTPLIGPVESRANGGLRFTYYDTLGVVVTPTSSTGRAAVRRIGIRVLGVNDTNANTFSDSMVTQVFLRNE